MKTQKRLARTAGLLYLLMALTAAFGFMIVPQQLIVPDDAAVTMQNILENELLFRGAILSSFASQVIFLFLALVLHRLFKQTNRHLSRDLLALVVASVPVAFFIIFRQTEALLLAKEVSMQAFESSLRFASAYSKLQMYEHGLVYIGIFWGLWLIPFGMLVHQSGFIPKIFGILLIAGGVSYLLDVATFTLAPGYHVHTNVLVSILSTTAEIAMVLWFLIKGVKTKD
ncbi:MAG: DUF4386 domain-containing protein [Bacteroidales bacterium]|nr:DUF4386 domain-containing protein [Bacteroidales bacterium]MCF8338055.1 DUF4386 domain-containing protein [Bacteroidales bacterium]